MYVSQIKTFPMVRMPIYIGIIIDHFSIDLKRPLHDVYEHSSAQNE